MKILKEIKGVFRPPIKKYYLGKINHGAPYFYPWNFNQTIISYRKLELRNDESKAKYIKDRPWLEKRDNYKFSNLPIVRRNKEKIIKIWGNYYFLQFGFPIVFKFVKLGWKTKYDSVRFEWNPQFHIFFFKWQFCIHWRAPVKNENTYWEMIIWYLYYSNKDIKLAEKTWPWRNLTTKVSTWDENSLQSLNNIKK